MNIEVNGKALKADDGATLETVVSKIGMQGPVAVSLNDEVVPYKKLGEHKVVEGDVIEIFTMLGGG